MSREDPFESAKFMCDWARRAVEQFDSTAKAFIQRKPYRLVRELNADATKEEVKIKLTEPIPTEVRGHASDAVKNIRDALDQAVAAATFVITGRRTRKMHFPFGESADDLENSLSRRKVRHCRDIAEELFPYIRRLKPYPDEHDTAFKALSLVSGDHKHAMALRLGVATNGVTGGVNVLTNGGGIYLPPRCDAENEEIIIAWTPPGGQAHLNLAFPLFVAFEHPGLWQTPASLPLNYWLERVTRIVLAFEAEAGRIIAERAKATH